VSTVAVVDIGTTAAKAAVVDAHGRVLAATSAGYRTHSPAPGWVEQDPDAWWRATCDALAGCRQALGRPALARVGGLALTGQMQDVVAVRQGVASGPAILYGDTRAVIEHERLATELGERWEAAVGGPPDATNVAAKWAWLVDHLPERAASTDHLLFGGHSYVAYVATGRAACDPTTAATTGLLELETLAWWPPVLRAAGLPAHRLPEVVSPTAVLGGLVEEAAQPLGLTAGTPVVHAPGDVLATTLGVVGGETGQPYAYLGTSGWVAVTTRTARLHPGMITLPGLDGEHWLSVAPLVTAGAAVDWAREALFGGLDVAAFDALAATACGAAEGLVFGPHLDGSRVPWPDPFAAGVLVGLRRTTTPAAVAAAVLEGVAHVLRAIAERLDVGRLPLRTCGGGARSDVWLQVLADVTGTRVDRVADEHAGTHGAASCAFVALGGRALPPPAPTAVFRPRPARRAHHRRVAPAVDGLLAALGPTFAALAGADAADPDHPGEPS
jgi:xylulokinase